LDVAQGLRRVGGNRRLYARLLRQFVDGQGDAAKRIRESLEGGDRAVAERLAHTVKGTAGNLAAAPVQAAAGALEKAIRDGDAPASVESLRTALDDALGRFASALGPWLTEQAPEAAPAATDSVPADPAALKGVVERWSRLLAECDAGTSDGLEREGAALRALFGGGDGFARFSKLVTAYEFEDALAALRRAAGEKGL
jgi:two-component system sensor histidine kinase/response regulator